MVSPFSDRISRVPSYSLTLLFCFYLYRTFTFCGLFFQTILVAQKSKLFFILRMVTFTFGSSNYSNHLENWPTPVSFATTNGISFDFFSFGY